MNDDRQADALEAIAEELAYQNAVLTELARATHQVAAMAAPRPEDPEYQVPTNLSIQTWIDDHAYTREKEGGR